VVSCVVCGDTFLLLGKCPTPCDYAARRNPDGAKLSFAFVFRRLKYLSNLVHPHQNYVDRKYWLNPKTSMIMNVKNNNSTAQRIIFPLALVDASRIPISSFPNNLTPTSNSLVVCFMSIIFSLSSIHLFLSIVSALRCLITIRTAIARFS